MEKEKEKDKTCEFIIVTGMSGSGKTQACRYLEDIGYFVVDNLPPVFIPKFAELCQQSGGSINKVVLVVDTRSREFLIPLPMCWRIWIGIISLMYCFYGCF